MKSYSLDFRQKIIETDEEGNLSQRQLAQRFRVALSFIQKLIKQWRATGNINPKPYGGGQKLRTDYWERIRDVRKDIKPIIEEVGARLEFLPPYSPDFSPIENFWSKVKLLIRSVSPRTHAKLEKAIAQAFIQITLRDIHNWFTHCCYCDSPFEEPI